MCEMCVCRVEAAGSAVSGEHSLSHCHHLVRPSTHLTRLGQVGGDDTLRLLLFMVTIFCEFAV